MSYVTDTFGLILTTTAEAGAVYRCASRLLVRRDGRALECYCAAVDADPAFALAYVGVAAAQRASGSARSENLAIARSVTRMATRRERQHVEVASAALTGEAGRALALCGEHLGEFPGDAVALHVVANAVAAERNETLSAELDRLVRGLRDLKSDG